MGQLGGYDHGWRIRCLCQVRLSCCAYSTTARLGVSKRSPILAIFSPDIFWISDHGWRLIKRYCESDDTLNCRSRLLHRQYCSRKPCLQAACKLKKVKKRPGFAIRPKWNYLWIAQCSFMPKVCTLCQVLPIVFPGESLHYPVKSRWQSHFLSIPLPSAIQWMLFISERTLARLR